MAIVGEAFVVVRAITTGFQKDVENATKGLSSTFGTAGTNAGNAFSRGASSGMTAFQKQSKQTYDSINRLIEGGYYLQGAIAGLVPVLASVVGGLFALGSQVAAAAPALIVLPSIFSAIAQGAIAMKLAFSGVFKAVGQLTKKQAGLAGATDRVKDAEERLDRVIENNKEARVRAAKSVEDAEKRLVKVREQAIEQLQQLNFDSEDAALNEKKAAIELEKARETLARVQDLPPNSRARREAELAFAEAELNLRKAKDANSDLAKEAEKQNKIYAEKGVNGLEAVVDAQEAVNDAKDASARTDRDALRAQMDAQKALDKAKDKASGGGGADPLEGLSPEAAKFAKYLADLKPKLDELKSAIGKELFPSLETAIDNLVKNLLPTLKPLLADTGKAAGLAAIDFSKIVTEADNLKNLDIVGKTNTDTIGKMGKVAGNLYSVFVALLAAADPLIRRFTDWVVALTDGWKNAEILKNEGGKLTGIFNEAGDVAAQLGRIFGNLGGAFLEMGKAASGPGSGGQMILDYFETATKKFKDFAKAGNEDGSLAEYFRKVSENFTKVMDILGKVSGAIMKTGDDKGTSDFLDSLSNAADILGTALGKLTEGGAGGAFGKFIEQVATFIASTSESGSVKIYFGILTTALDLLNKLLSNPIAARIFAIAAAAHGGRTAFARFGKTLTTTKEYITGSIQSFKDMYAKTSLVRDGFKYAKAQGAGFFGSLKAGLTNSKTFQTLFGQNSKMLAYYQTGVLKAKTALTAMGTAIKNSAVYQKLASAATKAWTGVQAAFNAVMSANPIALIVIGIVALIAIIVVLYMKFEWFRDAVSVVFEAIKTVISTVWTGIKAAFDLVWDAIKLVIELYWNFYIKPIFEAMLFVFKLAWDGIKLAFDFVWDAIKTAISFVWNNVIKPIFEAFGTVFSKVWDGIKLAFTKVWDFIKDAVEKGKSVFEGIGTAIKEAFKAAFNFVADIWNKTVGKLRFEVPSWVPGIGGKGFNVPQIPKLAEGGVIPARPGGMAAIIGEGGRPERVEPLDPDGLSKRDKAIIGQLATGAGAGMTVNVYPSPGMDEVELASLVGRQIALQLRRGAA